MVGLAPFHIAAVAVSGSAVPLFDWAAQQRGDQREPLGVRDGYPSLAELYRMFGRRTDVTPKAFGYSQITTPTGTWIVHGSSR
jgi:hypothetical protein